MASWTQLLEIKERVNENITTHSNLRCMLLPRFPHLLANSNKPIEQLISKGDGSELVLSASFVSDKQSVGDFAIHCPPDQNLGFPSQSPDFLDFL